MSVILKSASNATIYTFPSGVELVAAPFSKRLDAGPRAYQHGAVLIGDEKVEPRAISVHGIFEKASQTLMETELNSIKKACYTKNLRLYATQYANDFYFVEVLSFDHIFLGQIPVAEISIEFQCTDPFRYYKDLTTDSENMTSSPHEYTVANGGDIEVFPVFTFTAGGSISKVRVANVQDQSKYFEYEASLVITDELEIDCQAGTVKKNAVSGIANWTGRFLKLASGNNTITVTITGTVGTSNLETVFRKRYL